MASKITLPFFKTWEEFLALPLNHFAGQPAQVDAQFEKMRIAFQEWMDAPKKRLVSYSWGRKERDVLIEVVSRLKEIDPDDQKKRCWSLLWGKSEILINQKREQE